MSKDQPPSDMNEGDVYNALDALLGTNVDASFPFQVEWDEEDKTARIQCWVYIEYETIRRVAADIAEEYK